MARAVARSSRRADARGGREGRGEKVFRVPERFMRPRLVLLAVTFVLVAFGLLMIYSSSSVSALLNTGDAAYYLKRQLIFICGGSLVAAFLAFVDYRTWTQRFLMPVWVVTIVLLVIVLVAGTDNDMGASRWINLGFFDLQPSEFAKITVVITAAALAERYFDEGSLSWGEFVKLMGAGVGLPLVLIVLQPDKGTTMVLGVTIVTLGYLAGVPKRILFGFLALGIVGFLALSLKDDYSRQRLLTMLDPWSDPYNTGYQLIQGFYAFGTGGLFGVGIGFSRQKYSYLPMAHNDFIFAIIGEECGLVGTLGLLAGFAVFAWAGMRIALHAPDLAGRLVASGCTALVVIQMLLNVAGVIGVFPLSGKPIPFVSYGGSSIIASLMLVGMILSVSIHSRLPETTHDSMRRSWQVEGPSGSGLSLVGEPRPRSSRGGSGRSEGSSPRLTVVDGGSRTRTPSRGKKPRGRASGGSGGMRRIDLGPGAADRLRGGSSRGRRR